MPKRHLELSQETLNEADDIRRSTEWSGRTPTLNQFLIMAIHEGLPYLRNNKEVS